MDQRHAGGIASLNWLSVREGVSPDKQQKLDGWFEIYKRAGFLQSHHMYV